MVSQFGFLTYIAGVDKDFNLSQHSGPVVGADMIVWESIRDVTLGYTT